MAGKKPQDLRDILETIAKITGNKSKSKQSSSAMASAYVATGRDIKRKVVKTGSKMGHTAANVSTGAAKAAFGDPKKGIKDVAYNTGTWLIPYGKAFKVVNAGVKGAKYYKTAKAVRGAIKGATLIGAPVALQKAVNSIPSPRKRNITVPKKMKGK